MKKKLLFLIPSHSSYRKPIQEAFLNLGWEVKTFDYRKGTLPIRVYRLLPFFGGFEKAAKKVDQAIIKLNQTYKPDIILVAKGESLKGNVLPFLRTKKNKLVNLFPDYLNHWENIKDISQYYDFFFTFDGATIKKLKRIGRKNVFYMPQATQIEKNIQENKIYDVSFIGTYNPWRVKYLSGLKDLGLRIWGDKRWYNTSLKENVMGGRVSLPKMKQIIKQTKVNLNIFFDDQTVMEGVSLRPYEVTGSGGFLLTQFVKDYPNVYKIGQEIDWFKDPKEMVKKVKFYLKNETLREKIALAGYKRTIQDHTYDKRMQQMLEIIKNNS